MKRLALVLIVLSGCTLYFGGDDSSQSPPQPMTEAERLWINNIYPMLQSCIACHAGSDPTIDFLAGMNPWEVRDTLLATQFVSLDKPESSRLLTKGVHAGPSMTPVQASDLLAWLIAERDGR